MLCPIPFPVRTSPPSSSVTTRRCLSRPVHRLLSLIFPRLMKTSSAGVQRRVNMSVHPVRHSHPTAAAWSSCLIMFPAEADLSAATLLSVRLSFPPPEVLSASVVVPSLVMLLPLHPGQMLTLIKMQRLQPCPQQRAWLTVLSLPSPSVSLRRDGSPMDVTSRSICVSMSL